MNGLIYQHLHTFQIRANDEYEPHRDANFDLICILHAILTKFVSLSLFFFLLHCFLKACVHFFSLKYRDAFYFFMAYKSRNKVSCAQGWHPYLELWILPLPPF